MCVHCGGQLVTSVADAGVFLFLLCEHGASTGLPCSFGSLPPLPTLNLTQVSACGQTRLGRLYSCVSVWS